MNVDVTGGHTPLPSGPPTGPFLRVHFQQAGRSSVEQPITIALTCMACAAVTFIFWPVIAALIEVWSRSRTFAHGFLVLPGCLYLIWFYRAGISRPSPESWGWVAVALPGFGYMAGALVQNLLVQQASVIAMFPSLVYAIWGKTVFRQLLLPLGFLGFALPVGTALEPWLQDMTTTFLSAGLRASGIPFDREGYFFSLPSGVWEVAPDCGGLRYLLPGLALGYLYVAIIYRRPLSRFCFLVLCALLLILSNGVRAYGIIVSDYLRIADGTDHRVFSYSIYAVTIVLLAWLGRWRSDPWQEPGPPTRQPGHSEVRARVLVNAASAVALLLLISSILGSVVIPEQTSRVAAPQTAVRDGQMTATPLNVHAP